MPHLTTDHWVKLYYENTSKVIPIVFLHEFMPSCKSCFWRLDAGTWISFLVWISYALRPFFCGDEPAELSICPAVASPLERPRE